MRKEAKRINLALTANRMFLCVCVCVSIYIYIYLKIIFDLL
jgi:hypothetical protein